MTFGSINGQADLCLSGKRARRVIPPRYATSKERQAWLAGCEPSPVPRESLTHITANIEDLPAPAPKNVQGSAHGIRISAFRRRSPRPRLPRDWMVAWRTPEDSGTSSKLTWPQAHKMASEYERPRCWAVIIDAKTYTYLKEFGTKWKDLVKPVRKPAGKEASPCQVMAQAQ